MRAVVVSLAILAASCATSRAPGNPSAGTPVAVGMADVGALIPRARIDMRYHGSDNFVGRPVDGYEAPRCYLHARVAKALLAVQDGLSQQQQRLHIFDCYRPARAVAHFMRWARDLGDQSTKPRHYPALAKDTLVPGYIAERSGHSRGATVDLTLMQCDANGSGCTDLDMGTPFDFFDTLANTDDPRVTPAQRANRDRLRAAMQRHGFVNYDKEWWHYTFKPEPTPDTFFDVPVR